MIVNKTPKITVIMPVYNCELYIADAVDSILNQTYNDFELLIIDDASTDSTVSIIKNFNDERIQLIEKPKNSGYTNSLNFGLQLAKGEYIARMDGDDISLPERFEKQINFLNSNKNIIVCGSLLNIIGTNHIQPLPENHEDIKIAFLKGNAMVHPSVMFRNVNDNNFSILYDTAKEPAEDFDLWVRLLSIGELHNLQEVLLNYRVHDAQVSHKREIQQMESAMESRINMLAYLNCNIDLRERNLLKKILHHKSWFTFLELKEFLVLKNKLILANDNAFFKKEEFLKYLLEIENKMLKKYFLKRANYSPIIYFQYISCKLGKQFQKLPDLNQLKLFVKSMTFYKVK
ncbi:glycosyltransferase family 2 protein [Flavobacterium sp. YJ01]|uniref:glycosyltransferase family 2 protein n=1 Tax=unclassified Flavobacterium TaxID=196869 RepID=UPI0023E3B011|nr:glycosyltransferase family 2 protein [Flavobacterium sp. YJ01]WET01226.1 glycosyltransferase family 2 protein [Flavobacterium sp. YJ01]